ncbi:MAG: two-component system, chemotaxis family, CheB/CheR fusion protein [Verrucomicrobiota bacterium]|jgi:two-component system CheB/CheR fusion protein
MANHDDLPPAAVLDPGATDDSSENARNGAKKRRDPAEPCAVVGLGASAGGVAALQQFFGDMPGDSSLAFVVVMHLSPEHESNLAGVIAQKTSMPVMQVNEPVKVKPNHVYVIPPNHQLTFEESTLYLVPPQQAMGRRVTIDLFFRTLAQAFGQRSVAVILSGSDSDGVIGMKHIRAQGGVTIAQDPNEAQHDSMPATAISSGAVDWVLPVADMPGKLMEFVRNENRMQLPPEIPEAADPDAKDPEAPGGETVSEVTHADTDELALRDVLAYLRAQTGHDFSHYKRATLLRRIARRMQVNSLNTIPRYRDFLRTHPVEARALLQDLLIGVTHFFRDQQSFAALEANVPQLFAGRRPTDQIRVWVAGCSSGEEAYSVGMLLCEHADRLDHPPSFQIFASDLDEQAIQDARQGLYPSTIEADVSTERLRRFFDRDHGRYRIKKMLRERILFAPHNLLRDPPFSRVDLVTCRNLLIYLNRSAQDQVFDLFHFALRPGGLLFIGSAETGGNVQSLFSPVDAKHRLFVRRSVPRPNWRPPALLTGEAPLISAPRSRLVARSLPPLEGPGMEEASSDTEKSHAAGHERRSVLLGELHLKLLEEYGPPSVVVNEGRDIVHLSAKAGRYLKFVAGEPTADLLKVVYPELRVELRTALFRAAQTQETIFTAPQTVELDGTPQMVVVEVRPMRSTDEAKGFALVLFHRQVETVPRPSDPSLHDIVARNLDDEVQYLKEQLNATVDQYEGANEELKASNEELQAVNEEMRSASEELETSKEELQSVNEELTTVNHELKASIEDLSKANTDLNNLMASTDIGTIFLDRQLRIQRFTPSAQKIFNLLPADLGRPLSDITSALAYPEFIDEAHAVLDKLATTEREVRVGSDTWYLARIAPYRTQEDRIAGVVATFIDISARKRAEEELRTLGAEMERQLYKFNTVMSAVPDFVYQFDREGRFTYLNQALLDLWHKSYEEAIGKNFHELDYPPELATKLHRQIDEVIQTGKTLKDDTPYTSAIGERQYEYIFVPLRAADGAVEAVAGVTRDVTERRQAEEALRASEERFRMVADNVPQLVWTNATDGTADYFNRRWYEYSGLTFEESFGLGWQAMVHPDDAPASVERWQQALAQGQVFDAEYRLRRKDGGYRWFIGRNVPLRHNGEVLSWFGTATDIEDLKQAEAALRESEERFRLLVEGAKDYAMFLLDVENQITFWSEGAERVLGWTEEEAIGQSGAIIFTEEDKAKGAVEQELATALSDGSALDRRWHVRKDRSRLWTDGIMMRLDDESGRLRGFAKIARDATEQQRAEEALRHARDEMEQRVLERTRDLVTMNTELEQTMAQRQQLERELLEISEREKRRIGEDLHDLVCQELSATALYLKSNAKKLAKENSTASAALDEAAQTVNRNVGVARDLARGLQAVELNAAGLKNALRDLAAQACEATAIKCHFKCARGIRVPDDTVALHLYRVAQEAVTNAVKHSGAKNILISLDRDSEHICVSVQDDGKGFAPGKRRKKGLGLHMMRYRANALGGKLKIERRHSGGMDITCVIPVKPRTAGAGTD